MKVLFADTLDASAVTALQGGGHEVELRPELGADTFNARTEPGMACTYSGR